MSKQCVEVVPFSENLRKAEVPLSAAVKANGFVFVSGLPPMDPATGDFIEGDFATQAAGSLNAVKHALEASGSSLEKVCKVTVYVTNTAYFSTFNRIYREFFPENPPARTFVTVGAWPMEFDVEIECIAVA